MSTEVLEISNSYISSRKLPINYSEDESYLFKNELTWNIPNSKLFIYKDINISYEQIFYKGLKINYNISEKSTLNTVKNINKPYFFLKTLVRKKKRISTPVLWVSDLWSQGYYHWFSDVIQKIIIVKKHFYRNDFILLLPSEYAKFDYITYSLKKLNIQTEYINPDEIIRAKTLLFPDMVAEVGNYNETIINEFRNIILKTIPNNELVKFEKIYISRNKSNRRKIANEEEILPIIRHFGFEVIYSEDYDWESQLAIMSNAKYLLALHGAGLTNMLFMKNNSSIIEIRKKGDSLLNCYFSLSSALDFDYYYFLADAINFNDHHSDYIVNCNELEQLLSKIFK